MSGILVLAVVLTAVLLVALFVTARAVMYARSDTCRVDDRLRAASGLTR